MPKASTLRRLFIRLRRLPRNDRLVLAVMALAVGGAGGAAAILFRHAVGLVFEWDALRAHRRLIVRGRTGGTTPAGGLA